MISPFKPYTKSLLCAFSLLGLTLPKAQAAETNLHSFSTQFLSGAYPVGQLAVYGSAFYGVTRQGLQSGYGSVFRMTATGAIKALHEFSGTDGADPNAGLVLANGYLYGLTQGGGSAGLGVLYRIAPNGAGFTVLHTFLGYNAANPAASDGANFYAGLTLASDGKLYGASAEGGAFDQGIIFAFNPATNAYSILHAFSDARDGGHPPLAALAEGPDGALYGSLQAGLYGGLFKINKDGSGYTLLHTFTTSDPAGYSPQSDLIRASDGNLYGACAGGGANNQGTVFKLNPATGSVTPLWAFDGLTGANPFANAPFFAAQYRLLQGADGNLYGTTPYGGRYGYGTAFRLTLAGQCSVLANFDFTNSFGTANPLVQYGAQFYCTSGYGSQFATSDGSFKGYGTALAISATGAVKRLVSFHLRDTYKPEAPLAQVGRAFYGETYAGAFFQPDDQGALYRIDAAGNLTVLHRFHDDQKTSFEGRNPAGGLLLARDGNLYGACEYGGKYGGGTIFKITPAGAYTVLHQIQVSEGAFCPYGLTQGLGADDRLYGAFEGGGPQGYGSLFSLDTAGKNFTILHTFLGQDIGGMGEPFCAPVPDGNGYLYGTADVGIWKVRTDGTGFSVVYLFDSAHGASPSGRLALINGSLYGTTEEGGTKNQGVLFQFNTSASQLSVLHNFNNSLGEGKMPSGGVFYDPAGGDFYGCCAGGGANGNGTLYKFHLSSGAITVLHAFSGKAGDGAQPRYAPILGSDGFLYGTTLDGGANGWGTIYRLTNP